LGYNGPLDSGSTNNIATGPAVCPSSTMEDYAIRVPTPWRVSLSYAGNERVSQKSSVTSPQKLTLIKRPSEIAFFMDAATNYYADLGGKCSFRHQWSLNAVCVDGHTTSKKNGEILPWSSHKRFWRND